MNPPLEKIKPKEEGAVAKIRYLSADLRNARVFVRGKPESFEIFTSATQARLSGALTGMNSYALFIGTSQAENELSRLKGNIGRQRVQSTDIRELGEILLELADLLDNRLRFSPDK